MINDMKNKVLLYLPWFLLVSGVIIFFTFFKGKDHSGELKAKDDLIKSITSERDAERKLNDFVVSQLKEKDSLLKLKYQTNVIRYEKVPVIVEHYSNDELKRAVEEFR
jgi:hypothetical protein